MMSHWFSNKFIKKWQDARFADWFFPKITRKLQGEEKTLQTCISSCFLNECLLKLILISTKKKSIHNATVLVKQILDQKILIDVVLFPPLHFLN